MSGHDLLRKDQLERSLHDEKRLIEEGILKEDNPLDLSENFRRLCEAARKGDLKVCQEMIQEGVNINAKDQYDYTPLILASLCGHYETVQLLLESGALCERDTFQGERCLYNALNDKIRNLLLQYDYSKSTDPLQPLASHIFSLLTKREPPTSDITVTTSLEKFYLHKFILAARSPYFRKKLSATPDTTSWNLASIPPQSFDITLRHLYLGELPLPSDLGGGWTSFTDIDILAGIDKISKHLEIQNLSKTILDGEDRRLARQRRQDEVEAGRDQMEVWFRGNVLKHAVETDVAKADKISWDRNNGIFADVLLRADEDEDDEDDDDGADQSQSTLHDRVRINKLGVPSMSSQSRSDSRAPRRTNALGIPLDKSRSPSRIRKARRSVLYPCHKAMLVRSEYFMTMFDSNFKEAQQTPYLQIVSINCSPEVLEIILTFLYTEKTDFGLEIAIEVLFAADMLFLEKLKTKAAVVISSLGNGTATGMANEATRDDEILDIYEILRASWVTRVQRLEEFAARYIAYRLESYIDEPEFADIVKESASRIQAREETDTIELLDDIRYYLSERFRLRFEDVGFDEAMEDEQMVAAVQASTMPDITADMKDIKIEASDSPSDRSPDASVVSSESMDTKIDETKQTGVVRTLDGEEVGDEFAADAVNYRVLLEKIDALLDQLKLDA